MQSSESAENKLLSERPKQEGEYYSPAISKETRNISLFFLAVMCLILVWMLIVFGTTIFWGYMAWLFALALLIPIVIMCCSSINPSYLVNQSGMYFRAIKPNLPEKAYNWLFVPWKNISNIRHLAVSTSEGGEAWDIFDLIPASADTSLFFREYPDDIPQQAGKLTVRLESCGWAGIHFDTVGNLKSWQNKHQFASNSDAIDVGV
jgi:hypothetical protein